MGKGTNLPGRAPSKSQSDKYKQYLKDVVDFPKKGIVFRDITPLLGNGPVFKEAIKELACKYKGEKVDVIVGIEARGFIIGAALANEMGCGFVPIRKLGKLPRECIKVTYELEYGQEHVEIHKDAVKAGQKVLVVDDVLATGGTAAAAEKLVKDLGGVTIGVVFLVELCALGGRSKLASPIYSLIQYE